jgi:hypothetical protein
MFEERLPTKVWIEALIRRAQIGGAAAYVLQRGDASRGDVLIKVADLKGQAWAYAPRTSMDGVRIFVDLASQNVGPDEREVDDYIQRVGQRDPDAWIIEIEDRDGRHFLTEPVEKVS